MPAPLTTLLGSMNKSIQQLSLAQRVFAVLLAAGILLGAVALGQWATKPTMSPLYTNLSATDAAAIVDQLNASGVEYQLAAGGTTVMVPNAQLYDTRLAVAGAGLPANSDAGYALLDNVSMTSSEFQQQVTYQRALEGELAKTIGAMEGVQAASVKLAIPQDTVFVSEKAAPTASVFVETRAGSSIGTASVQAIVHLVSASIEGMQAEDVAVIDSTGVVLSTVGGDASTLMQAGQVSDYETRVASNVQAMLDRVVGVGNAVVSVSAELDYDKTARTTETFSADEELPPLNESTSVEEYTGGAATDAGILGPDNISVPAGADGGGEYRKETAVNNNAINKVTETLESAPGNVKRQSVSVVVSDEAAADLDMGDLETMVAAAAGVDDERGDVVSVNKMSFDTTTAETAQVALEAASAEAREAATTSMYISIAKWASLAIVVILVFLLILRMSRRAIENERTTLSLEAVEALENRTQEALEARAQAVLDKASEAAGQLGAAPVPDMGSVAASVRDEIMAFASAQPAEVAEVLRGWLVSGRQQ
ncbi:flagellar M-ring protein FliF [Demequina sp. TTPB684]|uniref:flagellar basal-body MS-ring/collar protein FliF n=1 Tax=unclassified Demequina TaxID=2620311 RepID=UPI001CF1ECDE|nr:MULTISPECIES: flagellar basal-body MS-ring/collar protein FliF [unclassified Demequina]MCB2411972.1 flagellar M-ring protein FliF [Demequina sp. TTPB684]UPU87896.1 flagellar M-ring protein FliF [Demequina sp. TMPB413]